MFNEIYKKEFNSENQRLALEYLVNYNLGPNAKFGMDKIVELPGMDFESTYNKWFLPSMMYTFKYDGSKEIVGKTTFIDHVPVILCCTNNGEYITGLNFNLMPNDIRANVLDIIYNAYKNFYSTKLSNAVKTGNAVFNEELAGFLITGETREIFFKILDSKTDFPVSKVYRQYKISAIKNPRLIEFDMWKYIPMLVFKDAIRGAGLVEVQRELIADK